MPAPECGYTGCMYEMEISSMEWSDLLHKARVHDLNKGGYYDARLGCINLWAGPEDKPRDPDWEKVDIRARALNYPRAFVGGIHAEMIAPGEWPEELREEKALVTVFGVHLFPGVPARVRLHFIVTPYEKAEAIEGRLMVLNPERYATEADLEWMREKFDQLREYVRRQR